ncbi:MAG: hypothetical protein H6831_05030 [Planctomycetes bacterium]|nr:hypothetical protein [Planctomycetota bacterium]
MESRSGSRGEGGAARRELFVGGLGVALALLLGAFAFGPWGDAGRRAPKRSGPSTAWRRVA